MNFLEYISYESMSEAAATQMLATLTKKPDALFCLATGNSPLQAYRLFSRNLLESDIDVGQLRLIQLDEWGALPQTHPSSCAHYIRKEIVSPLRLAQEQLFLFDGTADPQQQCRQADVYLDNHGPLDLCILGLGANGHLGFNEPAERFSTRTHIASLEPATREHQMVKSLLQAPDFGISLGIEDILTSRHILLLVAGRSKLPVLEHLRSGQIDPQIPASALWRHPNVSVLIGLE